MLTVILKLSALVNRAYVFKTLYEFPNKYRILRYFERSQCTMYNNNVGIHSMLLQKWQLAWNRIYGALALILSLLVRQPEPLHRHRNGAGRRRRFDSSRPSVAVFSFALFACWLLRLHLIDCLVPWLWRRLMLQELRCCVLFSNSVDCHVLP